MQSSIPNISTAGSSAAPIENAGTTGDSYPNSDIEKFDYYYHGLNGSALSPVIFGHNTGPSLRILGNPGPLGLYSFATTLWVWSMFNVHVRGVVTTNLIVGMSLFVGGLVLLLAGMWEYACGNTFGATIFSSYGGFWLSWSAIYIPGTGIAAAYASTPNQELNATGIYLSAWFIVTFFFFISSVRIHIGYMAFFLFLDLTYLLLMIANFNGSVAITKASGGLGIITSIIAYYLATAQLMASRRFFNLPIGTFSESQ